MEKLQVREVFSQKIINHLPLTTHTEIQHLLKQAALFFENQDFSLYKSSVLKNLKTLRDLLKQEQADFSTLISKESGKPIKDSKIEVIRAINSIDLASNSIYNLTGREVAMNLNSTSYNKIAYTKYVPIGPILAISAFNHPLNLLIHQIIPALTLGIPIIVKPSLDTPLTCAKLVSLIKKSGFADELCNMIICTDNNTTKICASKKIKIITFIGSDKVGFSLQRNSANGTKFLLEHGGTASALIAPDYSYSNILKHLANSAFYHAGQVCISLQNIYIDKKRLQNFLSDFSTVVSNLKTGDPLNETTDVGPIIRKSSCDAIENKIKNAVNDGATIVCGGTRLNNNLIPPTILTNTKQSSDIVQNEAFAPIVNVIPYSNLDTAIQNLNSTKYCFQNSLFTNDLNLTKKAIDQIHSKTLIINDSPTFRVDWMPFGGQGVSGTGESGIPYTMKEYCYEKLIVIS